MTQFINAFSVGLFAITGHLILVLVVLRYKWSGSPIGTHVISAFFWSVLVIAFSFVCDWGDDLWYSLSAFGFGFSSLLFLYSAVYKSVSLRILWQAFQNNGNTTAYSQLADEIMRRSFTERIDLLVSHNLVAKEAGAYRATPDGERLAKKISLLRRLLGVRTDGMYGSERAQWK